MPSYRMASRCARAEWRVASRLRRRPRSLRRRARFRQRNMARGRRRIDAARRRLGRHARRARGAARRAHVAGAAGGVCGVRNAAQIPVRWGQRCADSACRLGSHRGRRGRAVTAAGEAQRAASSVHRVVRLQAHRASCFWPGATHPPEQRCGKSSCEGVRTDSPVREALHRRVSTPGKDCETISRRARAALS